jgi:hypothetical protein
MIHQSKAEMNIVGDMNNTDGFGVGQFVNDAAKPEISDDDEDHDFIAALKKLEQYERKCIAHINCQIESDMWFIAMKNIKPNEELVTIYGTTFWLHKYLQQAKNSQFKLMVYSLHRQEAKPFNLRKLEDYDEDTCKAFIKVLLGVSEDTLNNYPSPKAYLLDMMEKLNIMGTKGWNSVGTFNKWGYTNKQIGLH